MIFAIAKQEITGALRDRRITGFLVILFLLLCLSVYISQVKYSQMAAYRYQAQKENREKWLLQNAKHPHMAAHFGNFAFKPVTPLNWIDYGVDNYTGTYVYMEPHRQNDFVFTPAQEQNASIRFGELSPSLILQVFVPLLIIFMCFAAITKERENTVLKLLVAQGISLQHLIAGKLLGYFTIVLVLLIPLLAGTFLTGFTINDGIQDMSDVLNRLALLFLFYLLYFFILTSFTVWISAIMRTSRASMLLSLSLWILWVVVIPKVSANLGADNHPLLSNEAFAVAIKDDIKKGIDGHNPDVERKQQLIAATLKQYGVDTVSKLPVNIDGIIMQKAEEYSSVVYDKHFEGVQEMIKKQNEPGRLASFIDPYLAIRNISMSLSLTDVFSHIHFQKAAEQYRRDFVQFMNDDMALHPKSSNWDEYKIDGDTYSQITPFTYQPPLVNISLRQVRIEWVALLAGLLFLLLLIRFTATKIPVV